MAMKKNYEYIDGWDDPRIVAAMAKSNVTYSQCRDCLNKIGTHDCKIFGKKPDNY